MGRADTPLRKSEMAPFLPKYRPLASRRSLSVLADDIARCPSSARSAICSVVSGKKKAPFLFERGPGGFRKDLPVDLDPRFLQPEYELAV